MAYLYNSGSLRMPARQSPYSNSANKMVQPSRFNAPGARLLSLNLSPMGAGKFAPPVEKKFSFNYSAGAFGLGALPQMQQPRLFSAAQSTQERVPDFNTDWQTQSGMNAPPKSTFTYNPEFPPLPVGPQTTQPSDPTADPEDTGSATTSMGPDWSAVLSLLQAQMAADLANARAQGRAKKKDILLGHGSRELARKVLGEGDDPFFDLISDDPDKSTSTMGMINRAYRDRQKETNEDLNAANLWYGGARGFALNQLNRAKLEDVEANTRETQSQLSQIDDEIARVERDWQNRLFDMMMAQQMQV